MHIKSKNVPLFGALALLLAVSASCLDFHPDLSWWERDGRRNFVAGTFERVCRQDVSSEVAVTVFRVSGHACQGDVCEVATTTVAIHEQTTALDEFSGADGENVLLPLSGMVTSAELESRRTQGVSQNAGIDELFADAAACGIEADAVSANGILPYLRFEKDVCSYDPAIAGCWPVEELENTKPSWAAEVEFP